MHAKNVLTINAIWTGLVAIVSILVPGFIAEQGGMEVTDATDNLIRTVGALSLSFAIISVLMRDTQASAARRAFLIGGGVGYVILALVLVFNYFTSELGNTMTWVYIVVSLLIGIDFLFFGWQEPTED